MSSFSNLKHHLKSFLFERKHTDSNRYKKSYSQCGEDLMVRFIFDQLNIAKPSYIDIGAHHPYIISNTANLHLSGCKGINIEPNPELFKLFLKERPNAANVNIGISEKEHEIEYYEFSEPALNTFSPEEKDKLIEEGKHLIKSSSVKTAPLKNILEQNWGKDFPDFLSIDVEGFDQMILNQINFEVNFPKVICAETISFSANRSGQKNTELINFIVDKGYFLHSDTRINSIFVRRDIWDID